MKILNLNFCVKYCIVQYMRRITVNYKCALYQLQQMKRITTNCNQLELVMVAHKWNNEYKFNWYTLNRCIFTKWFSIESIDFFILIIINFSYLHYIRQQLISFFLYFSIKNINSRFESQTYAIFERTPEQNSRSECFYKWWT